MKFVAAFATAISNHDKTMNEICKYATLTSFLSLLSAIDAVGHRPLRRMHYCIKYNNNNNIDVSSEIIEMRIIMIAFCVHLWIYLSLAGASVNCMHI